MVKQSSMVRRKLDPCSYFPDRALISAVKNYAKTVNFVHYGSKLLLQFHANANYDTNYLGHCRLSQVYLINIR